MDYTNLSFNLGDRHLVNQHKAKKIVTRILTSGRMGHAYLLSGPAGCGKTALALAFAELINGVDNLTNMGEHRFSKKSSWFTHPDIHLFLPMPTKYKMDDLRDRLQLLSKNPYNIVDFNRRPSLSDADSSKNRQAFYPIDYFKDEIQPKAFLKPNEGEKTVVILTQVDLMRKEAANAFLKLLEEPSENLIFVLTTNHYDQLLPTIQSRCQRIKLNALSTDHIEQALVNNEQMDPEQAAYMARISNGNYSLARYYDIERIKKDREQVINYLRNAYSLRATEIMDTVNKWQKQNNTQSNMMLLNILEMFLRDLMVYRTTKQKNLLTHINQLEVIKQFCGNLPNAALDKMIQEVNQCRPLLNQNVQAKLVFTRLSFRFSALMRDNDTPIPEQESWKHLPALVN